MKPVPVFFLLALASAASGTSLAAEPVSAAAADAARPRLEPLPMQAEPTSCLQQTGSHLKPAEGGCLAATVGHRYDREDIERTGSPTLGEALMRLDPTVGLRGR
jgi:hypothetical protein